MTNTTDARALVERLRGKYAVGPHLPNGNPEFGWRQFEAPPDTARSCRRPNRRAGRDRAATGAVGFCRGNDWGTRLLV